VRCLVGAWYVIGPLVAPLWRDNYLGALVGANDAPGLWT
jgi:hypothetical protein